MDVFLTRLLFHRAGDGANLADGGFVEVINLHLAEELVDACLAEGCVGHRAVRVCGLAFVLASDGKGLKVHIDDGIALGGKDGADGLAEQFEVHSKGIGCSTE